MTKPLRRFLKLGFFLLATPSLATAMIHPDSKPDAVGLMWTQQKQKRDIDHRLILEKETVDYLENQLGTRVLKSERNATIPPETLRLAKIKQRLSELNRQLTEWAFNTGDEAIQNKTEPNRIFGEINVLTSQLPKGTFGPEIQASRLAQSAWFWRNKNRKMCSRLFREAKELHPLRDLEFNHFSDTPHFVIFENECGNLKAPQGAGTCELSQYDDTFNLNQATWMNGFKIVTKGARVSSGNYFVIRRDANGKLFEKVIRCGSKKRMRETGNWLPVSNQLRIEQLIPSEFERVNNLLILEDGPNKFRKYRYTEPMGLKEWSSEEDNLVLRTSGVHSFPTRPEEKWYNKNNTLWWIAGALITTGAVLISRSGSQSDVSLKLKLGNGP